MENSAKTVVCEAFTVPAHIEAIAGAIRYDLMHGPSFLRVPHGDVEYVDADCLATFYEDLEEDKGPDDIIEETYTGMAAQALRDWVNELPSSGYVNMQAEYFREKEPEGEEIDGEWVEPYWEDFMHLEHKDIVECLLGKTIAKEFN